MECIIYVIIAILCCIILILSGLLLGIIIYNVCVDGKQVADNALFIGPHSDVGIQHAYETIEPVSPHWLPLSEDETGFIEDPYIPTADLKHMYYDLEEDNNYSLDKMVCNCEGACNCPTST